MAFHEVTFPDEIGYGSSFGPSYRTLITVLPSGVEQRVSRYGGAGRHRFELGYGERSRDEISAIKRFVILRQGAAHGFRIRDWTDYNSTQDGRDAGQGGTDAAFDDQIIGATDGATTQFQLKKTYTDGVAPDIARNITKPRGTVLLGTNGTQRTLGTDFSVDSTTGIVTLSAALAATTGHDVTAGYDFDVPVRFSQGFDEWAQLSIDDFDSTSAPDLSAEEIIDELTLQDDFWYGGSNTFTFGVNVLLSIGTGRVKVAKATIASKKLFLPGTVGLPLGGPYFYIVGDTGTNTFTVETIDGIIVATVAAGNIFEICLYVNAAGTRAWVAR